MVRFLYGHLLDTLFPFLYFVLLQTYFYCAVSLLLTCLLGMIWLLVSSDFGMLSIM